jgi:hypothetical protein
MSRFLSSLIDRTLSPTHVLQRRQPGLFEPTANAASARPGQLLEESSEHVATDHSATSSVRDSDSPSLPPRAKGSYSAHDVRTPSNQSGDFASNEAATHAPHSREAASSVHEIRETRVINISRDHIEQPQRTSRHARIEPPTQDQQGPAHRMNNAAETPSFTVARTNRPSEAVSENSAITRTPHEPVRTDAPRATRPVIPRIDTAANTARPAPRTVAPATTPVAPSVHVTIGRLEVRAVAPAATTTARKAPKAPRPTLEDYLRSRNGGSR